ncbi:ribosome biogenesis GTP-binding protein YihA/YsxC [Sphingobium nicotianae]|uniref:Probable GTP-binding protein EngB n=1 Tax=Sphingobium nicotianae TaxID=2782607 RepID=A0A9X1DA82_9SPHN|nr:ribosome biogenesis GTP-binding protein YihA/YsxC [Sphingobium nicotianae]
MTEGAEDHDAAARIEEARRIFAGPIAFLKSAPDLRFLPDPVALEVAFAGRSNVGKSSLINALTNRNGLARTSNTPGRTQELNFFDVGAVELQGGEVTPPLFRLVDMPGYGYAKAPKDMIRQWRFLVNDYLRGRAVLKRALVLIDSRHGIKDVDETLFDMLDNAAVSYRVVLTKADKVKASELQAVMDKTASQIRKRPAAHPEIIATSAEKGMGIPELRAAVIEALG